MSGHEPTVPREQRARGDPPPPAQPARQQSGQRGQQRPVRPVQPGPRNPPAQNGNLVTQHEDLYLFAFSERASKTSPPKSRIIIR